MRAAALMQLTLFNALFLTNAQTRQLGRLLAIVGMSALTLTFAYRGLAKLSK